MSKWILSVLILFGSAYINASVALGQRTPHPAVGDSYSGPCFVNIEVTCEFALAEWLTIQQPNTTIVQSCDSCNPEADHVSTVTGQPVYACFTYGKKIVEPAGMIDWVFSSQTNGSSLSPPIDPPTTCGTEKWCKPWCEIVQDLTLQCFVDPENQGTFKLRSRRENGPCVSTMRPIVVYFLGVFSCCALCVHVDVASAQSDVPLSKLVESLQWLEALGSSHDVEITAHRGSKAMVKGASDRDQFGEGIIKMRQIYDDHTGEFFIAYAMGSISIHGTQDPTEYSDVRVRYGGKDWAKESKKGGSPIRFEPCPKGDLSCRDMVSPVNFTAFSACCGTIDWQSRENDVKKVVERLSSLKDGSVSASEQLSNRRKQDVYRVTGTAVGGGLGIPVNKLVVSNEGFDKGLVVEYRGGGIEFSESKYTDDRQLMKSFDCSNSIVWKEFEVRDKKIETKKVVLPVSLSRKIQSSPYQQYLNVTFDWKSLQSPKPEVMNLQYCEKLCEEFEAKVNQTLRR